MISPLLVWRFQAIGGKGSVWAWSLLVVNCVVKLFGRDNAADSHLSWPNDDPKDVGTQQLPAPGIFWQVYGDGAGSVVANSSFTGKFPCDNESLLLVWRFPAIGDKDSGRAWLLLVVSCVVKLLDTTMWPIVTWAGQTTTQK